jgi:parvulin-like peptidyl-prolyl isomerase
MSGFARSTCLILSLAIGLPALTESSQARQEGAAPQAPAAVVAAVVNGESIYVAEVDAGLADLLKLRPLNGDELARARAGVLRQLINQRLIEQSLAKQRGYLDRTEVDKQVQALESRLKSQHTPLEEAAARRGVGRETLRHEIVWPLVWNKYLERHLADQLEGYFNEHRRELDGTQLRVSHILLRPETANQSQSQVVQRAEKIREQIESKKLTFAEAAEQYSIGPSRQHGGDLGFLPRYGVMTDDFCQAAFALKKGELSRPVTTSFGTHLLSVTDVKPGSRQWTDVIPQIRTLASKQEFEKLAKEGRAAAKIDFTGKTAYFKPDSEELVVPSSEADR